MICYKYYDKIPEIVIRKDIFRERKIFFKDSTNFAWLEANKIEIFLCHLFLYEYV